MQTIVFEKSEQVSFESVEQGMVLMDLKRGKYLSLNRVASKIWSEIIDHGSIDSATQSVLEVYDVDPAQARADVEKSISKWLELGLIKEVLR